MSFLKYVSNAKNKSNDMDDLLVGTLMGATNHQRSLSRNLNMITSHTNISNSNQNQRIIHALKNPSKQNSVDKLLTEDFNNEYCTLFDKNYEFSNIVGVGGNASVYDIDSERVLKRGHGSIALEKIPSQTFSGKQDAQNILKNMTCWDDKTKRYVCKCESNTEVFLTTLLSDLFEKNISPHFVVHERSFVCGHGPLNMILERLGISKKTENESNKNIASLQHLPELLNYVGYDGDDSKFVLQVFQNMFITALHTFAIMQRAYMMQSLDTRCENILFKIFTKEDDNKKYFKNKSLTTNYTSHFNYRWNNTNNGFYVPNYGLLLKAIDLGMGSCFGLELNNGETTTISGITQDIESTKQWEQMENLAEAAKTNKESDTKLLSIAKNIDPINADKLVQDAKNGLLDMYITEMSRRRRSRKTWGNDEKFLMGYDCSYLLKSMQEEIEKIEKNSKVREHHLVNILIDHFQLKYNNNRPELGRCLDKSPLQILQLLQDVATGKTKLNVSPERNIFLQTQLKKLLIKPVDDTNKVIVINLLDCKRTKAAGNLPI